MLDDVTEGSEALFESLWQHFAQPQHWRTFDDVGALTELRAQGFRIGIASNFDNRLMRIAAAHQPLSTCEALFVSSNVGFTKPDRRFFRAIEKQLGVGPEKIALVGDDEIADIQGAIAVDWRPIKLDRSDAARTSTTIQSLMELL